MRATGKTGIWLGLACLREEKRDRERGGGGLHRVREEAVAAAMLGLELRMEKAREARARLREEERDRQRGGGGRHRVREEAVAAAMLGLELRLEKAREARARCTVLLIWGG
jgi:hypothetical protein